MTRSASDNFNLDLMIAQRFGMTLDQVDALPLGLIEIVRGVLWDCDHDFEPVDGDNSDTATTFKCNNCRVEAVKGADA